MEIQLGLDPKDNLPDPPEPAPDVPMRLDESFSSPVEPSTPVTPIEAEPLYKTAAGEPHTADDSLADTSVEPRRRRRVARGRVVRVVAAACCPSAADAPRGCRV